MRKATEELSLRERKKAQTRAELAEVAKRCFAKNGYEATTMAEVARVAGVSEQTVYNYYPTKEALVFDREEEIRAQVVALADNDDGIIAAMHGYLNELLDRMEALAGDVEGGMVMLLAQHPRLRGEFLVRMDRNADALAIALAKRSKAPLPVERLRAMAVVATFTLLIDEVGKVYLAGRNHKAGLRAVRKTVGEALKLLDRGLASSR